LILLDTVRSDRVGFNGFELPTTPRIDEILGDRTSEAQLHLGDDGWERVARRLVAGTRESPDSLRRHLHTSLLIDMECESTAPWMREGLATTDQPREAMLLAMGLARLGDDAGRLHLRSAITTDFIPVEKRDIAAALTAIGDPLAHEWIIPTLESGHWRYVMRIVDALESLDSPATGFVIRDYVTEDLWKPWQARMAVVGSLGPLAADSDVWWTLALLSTHGNPGIRRAARTSLAESGGSPDALEAVMEACEREDAGLRAAADRRYDVVIDQYRDALARLPEGRFHAALRLRLARNLHLQERRREAEALLREVAEKAPSPWDRDLADRRLQMLESSAVIADPESFGCEVSEVEISD
jgi:hypothetical protein